MGHSGWARVRAHRTGTRRRRECSIRLGGVCDRASRGPARSEGRHQETASRARARAGLSQPFRSGFVAVVGRPNVGKSTLVNVLVGSKVAITSDKPQTTRSAVRGILNEPSVQVVFVDTPGYHKPRTLLGQRLNEIVRYAWSDVDVALLVLDGKAGIGRGDSRVVDDLRPFEVPIVCAVNKIDVLGPDGIAASLAAASALSDFEE